jgi:PAS domain-containing protein
METNQTAFELFESHRELERSERRYRAMVETAPMPFQSLDENGCFLDVNRAWLETLLPPDQVELFRERFPLFKAQGHIEKVDFRLKRADGSYLPTVLNGCIAYTEEGRCSHTVSVFQEAPNAPSRVSSARQPE